MKEKLAVTIWNYKGGVGKSTICLILAEIAAQKGLHVTAVDLDKQQNLAGMLGLTQNNFRSINVEKSLPDSFTDFVIVDTHPTQDASILRALSFADIVLLPILCDYSSLMNLADVLDFVYSSGVSRTQVFLVKNCMTNLQVISEIEAIIDATHFPIAGNLPRCNILLRNIASGFPWDKRMRENQRKPFLELYDYLWTVHKDMQINTIGGK